MSEILGIEKLFSVVPKKRFGRFNQFGTSQFGLSNFGDEDIYLVRPPKNPILLSGIYRAINLSGKTRYFREGYYITKNPRTAPQQANRQKYADGVLAWQNLTNEQKAVYNLRARFKGFSGYNLFLKEYLLSN